MFSFFRRNDWNDPVIIHTELPIEDRVETTEEMAATLLTSEIIALNNEIIVLSAKIARLRAAGKTVIAQRERWKALARATDGGKFDRLRRLLARELHPDHCSGEIEKAVRAELFKRLWPEVERIAEG